jgi:hypothetical protein
MLEIKAPSPLLRPVGDIIFLAGTIDMGNSVDWQAKVKHALADENVTLLNPRRDNWTLHAEQHASNPEFNKQVNWELDS